jgi:hypothetical protein
MMSDKPVTPHSQSQENEPAQSSLPDNGITASDCYPTLNPRFQADLVNLCPCCRQLSLECAFQPPLVKGKQGYTLCHCRNPQCQMYGVTLNKEQYQTMAALERLAARLARHLATLDTQKGNNHG